MKRRQTLLLEAARVAVKSILAHKLRTFLTLLGIIIGVASVMIVGASISGLETFVKRAISNTLGSNSFTVSRFPRRGNLTQEEERRMVRRNDKLKLEDVAFLREHCQDCDEVTAEISGRYTTYHGAEEIYDTQITGVTANTILLGSLTLSEGRFFSQQEAQHSWFVCVIGWDLEEKFFPNADAHNRVVKVRNQPLRVIGVLTETGSLFGQSLDNVLYMPITTYQKIFGTRRSIVIRGRSPDRETFEPALDQIRVAMRTLHHLKPGEEDDFGLLSAREINADVDRFTGAVAMVVTPITLISLLVGGIVVMNIMLVTVTERTAEIGVRRAVGARRRDILWQFLVESFLLASLGGTFGLMAAWVGTLILESMTPLPMVITPGYVVLSLGVSGVIGTLFGVYPAFQASKLDPIVALGTER